MLDQAYCGSIKCKISQVATVNVYGIVTSNIPPSESVPKLDSRFRKRKSQSTSYISNSLETNYFLINFEKETSGDKAVFGL